MENIASKILMVRPAAFGFNPQTAESNSFQKEVNLTKEEIQINSLREFDWMVEKLRKLGIEVMVFDDKDEPHTPDAIFPNNWFSTHENGTLCLYPMESEARRLERDPDIISAIESEIGVNRKIDLSNSENEGMFLEGTGSLILDHENKVGYACLSSRTNPKILDTWAHLMKFKTVEFHAVDENGKPIYHTNVMMCLGDNFAVICLDSIPDGTERDSVIKSLKDTGKEIIDISLEQMNNFAGNMLLLKNKDSEKILVMSERAFDSLDKAQIEKLHPHAELASFNIETIEDCGGGSVRCMMAEIF
jgi:hypothetical protein